MNNMGITGFQNTTFGMSNTKGKAYEHHMMSPEMHMPETHAKA